ncbi:MAG: hypothetical protein MJ151_04575 [Lachnospiraceae bacterium]|nr:hypothetical protein [Lachnospiraceae bacterium]
MSILQIILLVLAIIAAILVVLYFLGTRMQEKQAKAEKAMKQNEMTLSLLIIDKQKVKAKDSGLQKAIVDSIPAYMRWRKIPVVKARLIKANFAGGAQIMSLLCDDKVFKYLPTKTEVKVVISGIYITKLLSAKGVDIAKIKEAEKKKK